MPSLSEIGDSEALANRFVDRVVLLVEGPGDVAGFRKVAGPTMLVDFEFKLPLENKGGCTAVRNRVRTERDVNGNRKVFGLLDGESAAGLGAVTDLLRCEEPMFETGRPDDEGIIYLCGHEFENLFFAHVDVCAILANHCRMSRLADDLPESLSRRLEQLALLLFGAAMFKYASLDAAVGKTNAKILNTWFFGSEPGRRNILRRAKQEVEQLGGDWKAFLDQLFSTTRILRVHVATLPKDPAQRKQRLLRLADGKAMLHYLRGTTSAGPEVEGHLLAALQNSTYPALFQQEIRRRTS